MNVHPPSETTYDVIVIGGGIAGISIAYELAASRDTLLLEKESTLAFHTTGRSAAMFLESYGNATVRALTAASRDFLLEPPDMFEAALTKALPLMYVAGVGRANRLASLQRDLGATASSLVMLDAAQAAAANGLIRPESIEAGLIEPGALEVDVHELHSGYVRGFRNRGGVIATTSGVVEANRVHGDWVLRDADARLYTAPTAVIASGAWSDSVASLFSARPVGIQPLRRSVFMLPSPPPVDARPMLMTIDADDRFYVKPEHAQFLCSPVDEGPQPAGDAKPDDLEISRALDDIHTMTVATSSHVSSSWAGQRSFTADRTPVVGFDPVVDGVFWFAGQGGYGIQLGPALARTGATLMTQGSLPGDVSRRGVHESDLSPARFGAATS